MMLLEKYRESFEKTEILNCYLKKFATNGTSFKRKD